MPPGNENCLKSLLQALFALRDVRIELAVGAFQVRVRNETGTAVARPGDVDHVEVSLP